MSLLFRPQVAGGSLVLMLFSILVSAQELPKDAQLLIEENAKTVAQIQKNAEAQTKAAQEQFRAQLEKLQTSYTKDGKLDEAVAIRDYLRSSTSAPKKAIKGEPDPGVLTAYRSEIGRVIFFEITGSDYGTVYGTDVYTHDSRLSAAAVHAGVLKIGERAVVKVTILPTQTGFRASGRNGVSSSSWSASDYECFKVEPATAVDTTSQAAANVDVRKDPGDLRGYRDQVGKSFLFEVTGANDWSVYGTDIYTDDSALDVAVVHAGILGVGKKGLVKVTINGPHTKFASTSRNGVTSRSWESYDGSYKVEVVKDTVRVIELKDAVNKIDAVKNALNQIEAVKDALKK